MIKTRWASLALMLSVLPTVLRAADAPTRPNIVFILADDWGWGDLSCHGHPWLKTPRLDRLASEGIDFQQFNVLNPVCSPSRTAALTGRYPARYCIHEHFAGGINVQRGMPDWLDPKAPTLARFLQQAGYRTGHFGKWHLTNTGTAGAPPVSAYGFDESAVFNGPGRRRDELGLHDTAAHAASFIRANKDKPFYVNVWIHESHTPHVPTAESLALCKDLDERKQVYAAVISDGDRAVGQVLDALKETGVETNTIVIFASDNGPEWTAGPSRKKCEQGLGEYYSLGQTGGLRGRKRSLFEGGVRTPFIVRWPGHAPAGRRNEQTVVTAVDLLPTLCAAAGVKLPSEYRGDGENLLAAFQGEAVVRQRPIFWEWRGKKTEPDWWPRLAVREGDWKLVLTHDAKRLELHQLASDRAEAKDVAQEHPDVVARLTKLALDWKATLPEKPDPACISPAVPPASQKNPPHASIGVKRLRDLEYVEGGHARNRLDLYLPEKVEGRLPVIVWIHGGAWAGGSKEDCPAAPYVAKGYAVASINYRLSQHAVFPAQLEDCKAAVRWLRAHAADYQLDADHIGAWGASAGGHLAALLGTTGGVREFEGQGGNRDRSSRVQCVVDWFGPTDLSRIGRQGDNPEVAKLIGGVARDNVEKARRANPATYAGQDAAPFLIMHGAEDGIIAPAQSELLADALKKAGVEVTLVMIKGNGHGGPGFSSAESVRQIDDFFARHLKVKNEK